MSEMYKRMPIVALRNMAVLPDMLVHFDVKRKSTVKAINDAMVGNQTVLIVMQRDPETDDPSKEDLYEYGTVSMVRQIIKMPGNILRVMVEGSKKGYIQEIEKDEPYLFGKILIKEDTSLDDLTQVQEKAMIKSLKELVNQFVQEDDNITKEMATRILRGKKVKVLMTEVMNKLPIDPEDRQILLETPTLRETYDVLSQMLVENIEILKIKHDFQYKVKESIDKGQKDYILREQMKVIREELGEDNSLSDSERYLKECEELEASDKIKEKIRREIAKFKSVSINSSESSVIRAYIETLLALPWDKKSKDNNSIKNAIKVLDSEHYGLEKVKERILEFLAVRQLTSQSDAPIICLVGPPGTGKTSIARSVAKALNKEYVRICLGGVRDESEIRGHRRTYVGAMPGKLVKGLKSAGVKNPLILLDEIDKTSSDYKGDVSSALLEVLDSEQNNKFADHYIEIPIDLSEVLFIATANDASLIPRPLLDRMELIEVSSYTQNEKVHIAKEHLYKKQLAKNGLTKSQLSISAKAYEKLILEYTREAGVRNLERQIAALCRKAAREILEDDTKKQVKINDKNLAKYLGKSVHEVELKNKHDDVGIVRGLAWTSAGGVTLSVEVNTMPGKGNIKCTGQIGEVMNESSMAAYSYVRSISQKYDIDSEFFEKTDIHIHIPEGAVPKDGPSAGITMATALLSACTDIKVKANLAMTGEVTLRGKVLPIGGLKEKLLAAKQAQITEVIVPDKNRTDVEEMAKEITDGLNIHFVDDMKEVLEIALVR